MASPGPRTTYRYSKEFKATAVRLSQLSGVSVKDVAASLYIHPFMLSLWRIALAKALSYSKPFAAYKRLSSPVQNSILSIIAAMTV